MQKELVSVIHSGDKSKYIWPIWRFNYKMNWDFNKIPTIFISEEEDLIDKDIKLIKTGKINWSNGLINALKEIEQPYLIYQHEDYMILNKPDYELISVLLDVMKKKRINLLKCCGKSAGYAEAADKMINTNIKIKEKYLKIYPNTLDYLVSHQISIWNKEFLLSTLKENESPWEHEINGTKRLRERNETIYAWCSEKDDPECEPIPYWEIITKGKLNGELSTSIYNKTINQLESLDLLDILDSMVSDTYKQWKV